MVERATPAAESLTRHCGTRVDPKATAIPRPGSFVNNILVNASNLHVGGGVAVATSVIAAIAESPHDAPRVHVLASSEVDRNLQSLSVDTSRFAAYRRFDMMGVRAAFLRLPVDWGAIDVVLNVFGPVYHLRAAWRSVCGVAQPLIAFPNNLYLQRMDRRTRILTRAKYAVQALTLIAPRCLYVEQEQVRAGLEGWRILRRKRIEVVPNAVDAIYADSSRWKSAPVPPRTTRIRLGILSRNYPHKNLEILPAVKALVELSLGEGIEILVTLTDTEWASAPESMRDALVNVGPLTLDQGPDFYRSLDAVVFPTLMECFSATPIEARAVGTPVFASDLAVVRETVGDYATYFDPLSPQSVADAIIHYFSNPAPTSSRVTEPDLQVAPQPEGGGQAVSASRARALLRICDELVAQDR